MASTASTTVDPRSNARSTREGAIFGVDLALERQKEPRRGDEEESLTMSLLREFEEEEDGIDGLMKCHLSGIVHDVKFVLNSNAASMACSRLKAKGAATRSDSLAQPFADRRGEVRPRPGEANLGGGGPDGGSLYMVDYHDRNYSRYEQDLDDTRSHHDTALFDAREAKNMRREYERLQAESLRHDEEDGPRFKRILDREGRGPGSIGHSVAFLRDAERAGFSERKFHRFTLSQRLLVHTPQPPRRPLKDVFSGILRAGRGQSAPKWYLGLFEIGRPAEFEEPELPSNTTGTWYVFSCTQARLHELDTLHAAAKVLLWDSGANKANLVRQFRLKDGRADTWSGVNDFTPIFWAVHAALCGVFTEMRERWRFYQVLTYNNRICLDLHEEVFQDKYFDVTDEELAGIEKMFSVRFIRRKVLSRHFSGGVYGCLYIEFLNRDREPGAGTKKAARKADKKALAVAARAARVKPSGSSKMNGGNPAGAENGVVDDPPHEDRIAPDDEAPVEAIRDAVRSHVVHTGNKTAPGPAALASATGLSTHKIKRLLKKYENLMATALAAALASPPPEQSELQEPSTAAEADNSDADSDGGEAPPPPPPIWRGRLPNTWPVSDREPVPGGGRDATNAYPIYWADVIALFVALRAASTGCHIFLEELMHVAERWVEGEQYDLILAGWGS